jgi:hypothetical protein
MRKLGLCFASVGFAILALATPVALADQVPRTEIGSVALIVSDQDYTAGPVTRGEIFGSVTGRPSLAARIDQDVNTRARPGPVPGPAAGSHLFGYQLGSGVAYCEPLSATGLQQRRQCFRDFNDDGVFDGGYVTSRGGAARYFVDQVETLVPVAPLPYVPVDSTALPEVTFQLRLVRVTLDEAAIAIVAGGEEWTVEGEAVEGQEGVFAFTFGTFRITWIAGNTYQVDRIGRDQQALEAAT